VEEFVSILLSVPLKETSTITMICDDALGSAIDSRKFATEFINRRRADLNGVAYDASQATVSASGGGGEWTSVPPKKSGGGGDDEGFKLC